MIVTEEEAKTKRCQESFGDTNVTADGHVYAAHISYGASAVIQTSPSMCIGSACMAFRWVDNLDDKAITEPRGYCGKAGRP